MKEKEIYLRAELEIIELTSSDIICASGDPDDMSNVPQDGWGD